MLLTCQSLQPLFTDALSVSGLCRALGTPGGGASTWSLTSGSSHLGEGASNCEGLVVVSQGKGRLVLALEYQGGLHGGGVLCTRP